MTRSATAEGVVGRHGSRDRPCTSVAGKLVPAAGRAKTGDFLAVARRPDDSLAVVVGDAGGSRHIRFVHRVAAHAARTEDAPSAILKHINRQVRERQCVVSAAAVIARPNAPTLTWTRAGALTAALLDAGELVAGGDVDAKLGESTSLSCCDEQLDAPSGSGLLIVTDGVLDATGPAREPFGSGRLSRVVEMLAGEGAPCTVAEVLRTVRHFSAHQLADDAAAVAIRLPVAS
jgi:hypothetical protein